MSCPSAFDTITTRLEDELRTRILFFGSSNTEHIMPGMHWSHVCELALQNTYGRHHFCINTGIGGDTSLDLLNRFEEDVALFRPHLTIVTIGGNDYFQNTDFEQFRTNLFELHGRLKRINSAVAFQTYYAPDPDQNDDLRRFYRLMQIVCEVAMATDSELIDHLARWEKFRQACPEHYKPLMHDGFHLNNRGNKIVGLDLARSFTAVPDEIYPEFWREAHKIQQIMDTLETAKI